MKLHWKVTIIIQDQCPDYKPDPYTGEYPNISCAVYHCHTEEKEMVKEFPSVVEADEFKKHAPENCHDFTYEL